MRIVELNGSSTPKTVSKAPTNFLTPLYNIHLNKTKAVSEKPISISGINPGDYIAIPEDLRNRPEYKTKTIGQNYIADAEDYKTESRHIPVYIPTETDEETETISDPNFQPVKLETVSRQYIDTVEIQE